MYPTRQDLSPLRELPKTTKVINTDGVAFHLYIVKATLMFTHDESAEIFRQNSDGKCNWSGRSSVKERAVRYYRRLVQHLSTVARVKIHDFAEPRPSRNRYCPHSGVSCGRTSHRISHAIVGPKRTPHSYVAVLVSSSPSDG